MMRPTIADARQTNSTAPAARSRQPVIRAFVEIREQIAANNAILKRLAEIDNSLLVHDASLRDIYKKLMPLLAPSPLPLPAPKRKIGFNP